MAIATPRFLYPNLVRQSGMSLSASSEESSLPAAHLLDQARGRRWRTKTGWTIVPGFNDGLHFRDDDGYRVGHIVAGNYATGSSYATAVQTAMNAAGYNLRRVTALGLSGWYRGDSVTLVDGRVSQANDLSGNARHLSQSTAATRPFWVANALDGRPGFYFDGTAAMRLNSTATGTNFLGTNGVGTIYVLFRLDSDASAGDNLWRFGASTENARLYWSGTTNFTVEAYDTSSKTATKAAGAGVSTVHLGIWHYNHTNLSVAVDDADSAAVAQVAMTGALHANIMAATLAFGSLIDTLKGYIYELAVFSAAHSEAQRRAIVAYFKSAWPSYATNDATTAPAWTRAATVAYSGSTHKHTVSMTGTTFEIPIATDVPAEVTTRPSAWKDLGFTVADKTGATSYTAESESYQSRHYVKADLGATAAVTSGAALDHNAGSGGTFTVEGNDFDGWASPPLSEALSGDTEKRIDYWTSTSRRYWRLIIDDAQNADGFAELGVWSLGVYVTPSVCFSDAFNKVLEELSSIAYATHGAHYQDERPVRWVWNLDWSQVPEVDRSLFELLARTIKAGGCLFVAWDPVGTPSDINYVFRREAIGIQMAVAFPYWNIPVQLVEALE